MGTKAKVGQVGVPEDLTQILKPRETENCGILELSWGPQDVGIVESHRARSTVSKKKKVCFY